MKIVARFTANQKLRFASLIVEFGALTTNVRQDWAKINTGAHNFWSF